MKSAGSDVQRVPLLLAGLIKNVSLYPPGHPTVTVPLAQLRSLLAEAEDETVIGVVDDVFFIGDNLFPSPRPGMRELLDILTDRKVPAIAFRPDVSVRDLGLFAELIGVRKLPGPAVADELSRAGVQAVVIRGLSATEETSAEEDDFSPERHMETYREALSAVESVWHEVEAGRIPHADRIVSAVDEMAKATIKTPSALLALSMIKKYDNYTFHHSVNVGILAMALAASAGADSGIVRAAGLAGLLHDVGKTGIDKKITNKPGRLAPAEFEEMKKHSEIGARIIGEMAEIDKKVAEAVLGHHIHFNRKGYPEWAQGLPFGELCEIIAVADMYDATTTLRVYQRPLTPRDAIDTLRQSAGKRLNPRLVEAFVGLMGEYPVGTLVRLDTNELAVVCRPNPRNIRHPFVKVVTAPDGAPLHPYRTTPLILPDGQPYAAIVATVPPATRGIDIEGVLGLRVEERKAQRVG